MPPKKAPDDATSQALTPAESHFIKALFDNMTVKPSADWAGVAAVVGLKTGKAARDKFRMMCLRHDWRIEGGPVKEEAQAGKEGRVEKRKRGPKAKKIKVEEGSEGTEGTEETESTD